MKEVEADLWVVEADLRVVTTNGYTRKSDGGAVMGRGCAREATRKVAGVEGKLGALLDKYGNRPFRLAALPDGSHLASLPVKHHWREEADPELIRASVKKLVELVSKFGYSSVVLPRPGCGNGGLRWDEEVKPAIEDLLDERFTVVSPPQ